MADVILDGLIIPDAHVAMAKEGLEYLNWELLPQDDRPATPGILSAAEVKVLERRLHREWLLIAVRGALYRKREIENRVAEAVAIEAININE